MPRTVRKDDSISLCKDLVNDFIPETSSYLERNFEETVALLRR